MIGSKLDGLSCQIYSVTPLRSKTRKHGAFQIILPQRCSKTSRKTCPQYHVQSFLIVPAKTIIAVEKGSMKSLEQFSWRNLRWKWTVGLTSLWAALWPKYGGGAAEKGEEAEGQVERLLLCDKPTDNRRWLKLLLGLSPMNGCFILNNGKRLSASSGTRSST